MRIHGALLVALISHAAYGFGAMWYHWNETRSCSGISNNGTVNELCFAGPSIHFRVACSNDSISTISFFTTSDCSGNRSSSVTSNTSVCVRGSHNDSWLVICKESCSNGIKDGTETDVDCGGNQCPKCGDGKMCQLPSDCQSNDCVNGLCVGQSSGSNLSSVAGIVILIIVILVIICCCCYCCRRCRDGEKGGNDVTRVHPYTNPNSATLAQTSVMANAQIFQKVSSNAEITDEERQHIAQLKIIPGIVCRYCDAVGQHYSLQCSQANLEEKGSQNVNLD